MQALGVVLCALFVAGLLHAERTHNQRLKSICKPLASLTFVALGAWNLAHDVPPTALDVWIVVGLLLGAAGDVCLMLRGSRWFLAGLFSFLIGHVAYTAGFISEAAPRPAWLIPGLLGGLLVGLVLRSWWPFIVKDKRLPVIAYAGTIVVLVTAAAGVARAGIPRGWVIFAAATLFAVSDVAVLRERFVARGFVNKAWGLPLYYTAQLLLASCVGLRAHG